MSGTHLSKEFFELIKSIGESRSKQEEDQIIVREVQTLKKAMAAQGVTSKQMKEFIIRMIYVEMLGHDASFGHIHAVKMVAMKDLLFKRVGYLGCTLCLHSNHQFMLLLVSSLQRDLVSDNYLEVSMALTVITKLVNAELIPPLMQSTVKALDNAQANVRKKAIMALHRFYQLDPSSLTPHVDKVRKILCDKDPSVMGASLWMFIDLCTADAAQFKDLVPSFVSILKQVIDHRLPRDYDYHRMPAPWVQLCLLQILALLGTADKHASEGMYEVLHECMKRADVGINVGYAIVYECVRTALAIYPDNALIEDAAKAISRFISSDNHNLKYLGITALSGIVQINAKYAVEHQLMVIDCLEDPDETLKRKTLELLVSMTNPANVIMVVDKLTAYLRQASDVFLRTDLVARITQLAEKFAPNNAWYLNTMNNLFELGGDLVRHDIADNLLKLIAEGVPRDNEDDIRHFAVNTYVELLQKPVLSDILMQVIAWVVGEYAYLCDVVSSDEVIHRLVVALDRSFEQPATRAWYLTALMKVSSQLGRVPPVVETVVQRFMSSVSVDLQQRAHEFSELAKSFNSFKAVFPRGVAGETVEVDPELHLLDAYVQEALASGAAPYSPPVEGTSDMFNYDGKESNAPEKPRKEHGLNFQPYQNPNERPPVSTASGGGGLRADLSSVVEEEHRRTGSTAGADDTAGGSGLKINARVKNVWGPDGFNEAKKAPVAASSPYDHVDVSGRSGGDSYGSPYGNSSTSTPSSTVPVAQTRGRDQPPQQRQLSEREIMAQSLFAGLAGTPAPAAEPVRAPVSSSHVNASAGSRAPAAVSAPAVVKPVPAATMDLLSADMFDMTMGSGSAASAAPASTAAAPAVNGFASQTSAPVGSPVRAAGPLDPLAELSGVFSSTPAGPAAGAARPAMSIPATAPGPQRTKSTDLFDLFGDLTPSNPSVSPPASSSFGAASPVAPNGFGAAATNGGGLMGMGLNAPVAVRPAASLDPLAGLMQPNVSVPAAKPDPLAGLVNLGGSSGSAASAAPAFGLSPQRPANAAAPAAAKAASGLVPEPMQTPQFGALWKQFAHETKIQVVPTTCATAADYSARVQQNLNVHVVQVIGMEVISAGKAVGSNQVVLVHGKLRQGSIDIIIRSQNMQLNQSLVALLKKSLA